MARERAARQRMTALAVWVNPRFPLLRFIQKEAPSHWTKSKERLGVPAWLPPNWRDKRCWPIEGSVEAIREWFDHQIETFEQGENIFPGLTAHRDHPDVAKWLDDTTHDALLLVGYVIDVVKIKVGMSRDDAERLTKEQRAHIALRALRDGLFNPPPAAVGPPKAPGKKRKRSTERGEGREKLISALTKHHAYANGGCLNLEPAGNNALARLADPHRLVTALKALNGEFRPRDFYLARKPDEIEDSDAPQERDE
ncbi:MAG TPA: hypothetical protein VG826_34760 [Pirellulales bacterium]|nr:hypothetical protein [Pirellulales bacterium]